ncbi:MAG: NAD-dependent epimerase/dehydratase family protein [Austwickia sp.]|nr:NAD-dependent epimerase/dehydratase family protein [Austwickia sp.]MBK9101627.1 NAD-dependent epimerase/dehydratase family protein [Austwickia sp.]
MSSSWAGPDATGSARGAGRVVVVTGRAGAIPSALLRCAVLRLPDAQVRLLLHDERAGAGTVMVTSDAADEALTRRVDLSSPGLAAHLQGAHIVIHVALGTDVEREQETSPAQRRAESVRFAQTVLTSAVAVGARHVVVITSARVYGARPDNPVPLTAADAIRPSPDAGVAMDLVAVEDVVARARTTYPGVRFVLVRPAPVVGEGTDTAVSRHFAAPRLLTIRDTEPLWQFIHVDDLATAVATAIEGDLGPVVNVAAPGWLTQEEIETITGMRRIEVSRSIAVGTAQRLHQLGLLRSPAADLDFVAHPWVVDAEPLRAAGWAPAHDNEDCLRILLEGVHAFSIGLPTVRKDAALGAASAAVAMVATAAIMRRRRRKGTP